ncbi:peptidase domain-containing ABC transporter [Pyxidicoccus sp. 3LG]
MTTERKPEDMGRFPALRRLKRPQWRRRIPEVIQLTATDCGAACLSMVLAYHGREMSLEQVRSAIDVSRDGITAKALLAAGRKLGLKGRGVSLDLGGLEFLPVGAILYWRFAHYVVFEKKGKDFVQILDPNMGRRRLTLEQFSQSFTGVALLLEPADDFQPGSSRRNAWRYFLPMLRYKGTLARIIVMSAVMQLLAMAVPVMMGLVVDKVVPRGDFHLLLVLSVVLVGLVLFQFLATLVRGHLLLELRTRADAGMTLGFLDHLVSLAYSYFQVRPAGELIMRLNVQATVREVLASAAVSSILDGALVLLYLGVLLVSDLSLGLVVLGLGLVQVLLFLVPRPLQRSLLSRTLELEARSQSYQIAMLTGMQTLKAFGVEQRMVQSYSNLYVDLLNVGLARGRLNTWLESMNRTLRLAAPLLLLCVGAYRVLGGGVSLGQMLSMNALAAALLVPLFSLMDTGGQLLLLDSYLERLNDVLDTPPERPPDKLGTPLKLKGSISLEQVSFRYSEMSALVVQDLSVRIQPGQMVAIVGRSGAGKTTLAHLLLGLYLPTSGRVMYDGVDLNELDLRATRGQMGIVPQDSAFFIATVRDNITLSDTDCGLEQVMEAAKLAHIHDDIMAMPMQYSTPLADRGLSLSGGQRQRLALARALLRKPAVLLLDEATSALDAVTEAQVQEALAGLRCTRIVIAHRLSTIRSADLILVMEGGRVVESGRHEELLARQGAYARLLNSQLEQPSPVRAAS